LKKNQIQYESWLEIERNRVELLETSYSEAKLFLASGQNMVTGLERSTYQMRVILDAEEQERAQSIQASHLASTKQLDIEQDMVRKLKESGTKDKALVESMVDALQNPQSNLKQYWQLADAHHSS
jgi:hypothetical protein